MKNYGVPIVLMAILMVAMGISFPDQPKVVEVTRIKVVEVEKPIVVEKIIEKVVPVYTDKPIYIKVEKLTYPDWKTFDNITQLKDMVSVSPIADNACLIVAQDIQKVLLNQGYVTSVAVSFQGKYNGTKVSSVLRSHAGLLVETNEGWYFIDLYPWRATKLF